MALRTDILSNMRRQQNDCPNGGFWYTCGVEFGGFSGCCTMEPCFIDGGCPKDRDLTPGRCKHHIYCLLPIVRARLMCHIDKSTSTTATIKVTSSSLSSEVSFAKSPLTTLLPSQSISSAPLITSLEDFTQPTAHATVDHQPSAASSPAPAPKNNSSSSLAYIIGAAIGAVILAVVILLLLRRRRRQKHKNIHQAPIYVSPYNTSSDLSQDSGNSYHAEWCGCPSDTQQHHSTAIRGHRIGISEVSLRPCAELPSEPVARSYQKDIEEKSQEFR